MIHCECDACGVQVPVTLTDCLRPGWLPDEWKHSPARRAPNRTPQALCPSCSEIVFAAVTEAAEATVRSIRDRSGKGPGLPELSRLLDERERLLRLLRQAAERHRERSCTGSVGLEDRGELENAEALEFLETVVEGLCR